MNRRDAIKAAMAGMAGAIVPAVPYVGLPQIGEPYDEGTHWMCRAMPAENATYTLHWLVPLSINECRNALVA
jgi:hypothetical protein